MSSGRWIRDLALASQRVIRALSIDSSHNILFYTYLVSSLDEQAASLKWLSR
jgi:hypothetical protein